MEAIAGAPDGLDAFIGMAGDIFQLVTQAVDMDGDSRGFTDGVEAPDLFEELLFRENFIRMLYEEEEQVEFFAGERHILALQEDLTGFRTDIEIACSACGWMVSVWVRRLWVASCARRCAMSTVPRNGFTM